MHRRRRWFIINMASLAGVVCVPAHLATKAGLIHLSKQVALDFGKDGVALQCLLPGARTRRSEQSLTAPMAEALDTDLDGLPPTAPASAPASRCWLRNRRHCASWRSDDSASTLDRHQRRRHPLRRRVRRRSRQPLGRTTVAGKHGCGRSRTKCSPRRAPTRIRGLTRTKGLAGRFSTRPPGRPASARSESHGRSPKGVPARPAEACGAKPRQSPTLAWRPAHARLLTGIGSCVSCPYHRCDARIMGRKLVGERRLSLTRGQHETCTDVYLRFWHCSYGGSAGAGRRRYRGLRLGTKLLIQRRSFDGVVRQHGYRRVRRPRLRAPTKLDAPTLQSGFTFKVGPT